MCGRLKLTWFLDVGRKSLGFDVNIKIDFDSVSVVEIDLVFVSVVEVDVIVRGRLFINE